MKKRIAVFFLALFFLCGCGSFSFAEEGNNRQLDPTYYNRPPEKEGTEVVHNPQAGVYAGFNKITNWQGGYVKYKADFSQKDSNFVPGVGVLGSYTQGSAQGGYKWDEVAIGPLVGAKYFFEDEEGMPGMLEGDLALQYYSIRGRNTSSGYSNRQEGLKVNARLEGQKLVSENWTAGVVAEGNIGLVDSFGSSWSGDSPSNRNSIEIGGYGRYRINDDWEWQGYAGLFHQGWDSLTGVKVIPLEFRYHKWLKFGAGVSFFPFGLSNVYDGIASASNLITPFGFVQVNAGPLLRKVKANSNQDRVIPIQKASQK